MPSSVMVFSHPNHEIAVLGTIFRLRPHLIYLTDGGGEPRVAQTKQALQGYQPATVHFLDHSEQSLYEALLAKDSRLFRRLAAEVSEIVQDVGADTVYCGAVEFYNPMHDIALPVVRAALGGNGVPVFEVPIIYQTSDVAARFALQSVPESLSDQTVSVELSPEELDRKIATIESGVYTMLFTQLGGRILDAARSSAAECEHFLTGRPVRPSPVPGQLLRYERRGRALKDAGAIPEVITFEGHYTPIFEALCGAA